MFFYPILAHGTLGGWDEVVFLSIAAVFLLMMGISWVRSRVSTPTETEKAPQAPEAKPDADSPDHFTLS